MSKTNPGNFFEDFELGQTIDHATPRTITEGDRALYGSLYPTRFSLPSSAPFAAQCGLVGAPVEELIGFHIVPQDGARHLAQRRRQPGTPSAGSIGRSRRATRCAPPEVTGLKENSNGKSGVVYVRSTAVDQHGAVAIDWARWVMVHKRDHSAPAPATMVPDLAAAVAASDLIVPDGLDFTGYDFAAAGEPHRFDDYEVGEKIDHVDGVTLTDAEHMMAHLPVAEHGEGPLQHRGAARRVTAIYGGHIISMARRCRSTASRTRSSSRRSTRGTHRPGVRRATVYAWPRCRQAPTRQRRVWGVASTRRDQAPRRVDDVARRGRQVRVGRAARPRHLGALPALSASVSPRTPSRSRAAS
jgi:2-methylfumaryl-CoA hydratase